MVVHYPLCSIVIPTRERPQALQNCLRALAQLDYPRDGFEVIVVDDGSRVNLEPVIAPITQEIHARLVCAPHAGPAAARNAGARQARGELLAFTDDDCMPDAQWLAALVERYVAARDGMFGGKTVNSLPTNLCSSASQLLIDYLYQYYNADPDRSRFIASNNMAVPAERFHRAGGFDESFPKAAAEDREFCDRWISLGYRIALAPKAIVYHAHPLRLRTFWRQHFTYGTGAWQFRLARARRSQQPVALEPLSFYADLLAYPFRDRRIPAALALAWLLLLTQMANAAGFAWARHRGVNHNAQ